ncbi:MAG: RdgB/HAM1 family non-canonical purine NTP pyrophosphatase [Candidatus Heimdallarchaeota archaeon]
MNNEENLIYFVTSNNHKFLEITKMFEEEKLHYKLKQLNIETTEIQADSVKQNAFFKLNSVKSKVKGSCFVEDAGFFIDKPLNGFPGVYSSYVFKTIGNEGVLRLIDNFKQTKAHFIAIIALFFKPLNKVFFFEGRVEGRVSEKIRGSKGFGFDPIFISDKVKNKTFAELTLKEKNKISHRGIAWKKMIEFLRST